MIRIKPLLQPQILKQRAGLWRKNLLAAKQNHQRTPKQATKRAVERAEGKYRHNEVKAALVKMFHGKCAYCESKIIHVDYGHIEHYRPKSQYPEQTFEWTNLLLACGICNGPKNKSDRFPNAAEDGPLLNPREEEPGDHLDFHFEKGTQLASVYGKTPRGVTTEEILGLNRPALRSFRSAEIRKLIVLARFAQTDAEAKKLLDQAIQDDAQFAAFARRIHGDPS